MCDSQRDVDDAMLMQFILSINIPLIKAVKLLNNIFSSDFNVLKAHPFTTLKHLITFASIMFFVTDKIFLINIIDNHPKNGQRKSEQLE